MADESLEKLVSALAFFPLTSLFNTIGSLITISKVTKIIFVGKSPGNLLLIDSNN